MDTQQLEYWAQVQNRQYLSASDNTLELPPDLSQTPSLSASPVSNVRKTSLIRAEFGLLMSN